MSINRRMDNDVVHTHSGVLFSHKKNEITPFAVRWMDPGIIILSGGSQKKTNPARQHLYAKSNVWPKRTYLPNRNRLIDTGDRLAAARDGVGGGGEAPGVWGQQIETIHAEWINNKVLLYSTGNYIQHHTINHNGKEHGKEYICITESLCCTAEINTTL